MLRTALPCLTKSGRRAIGQQCIRNLTTAEGGLAADELISENILSLNSLPPARWQIRFRSQQYSFQSESLLKVLPGLKAQSGDGKAWRFNAGAAFQEPVAAWACSYFSIRAHSSKMKVPRPPDWNEDFMPFPLYRSNLSQADYAEPSHALEDRFRRENADEKMAKSFSKGRQGTYQMNLTIRTTKKQVSRMANVRHRVAQRLRHATRLVAQYGIQFDEQKQAFVAGPAGPPIWLLPGHTYVMVASLEILRMPYSKLVNEVGRGLREIKILGQELMMDRTIVEGISQFE